MGPQSVGQDPHGGHDTGLKIVMLFQELDFKTNETVIMKFVIYGILML